VRLFAAVIPSSHFFVPKYSRYSLGFFNRGNQVSPFLYYIDFSHLIWGMIRSLHSIILQNLPGTLESGGDSGSGSVEGGSGNGGDV